jgi:hypothetical protein
VANRYDDAVKALCAGGLGDLCDWVGVKVEGDAEPLRLSESAPPATTRQVDLLVEVDPSTVLHIEFQKSIERRFAERMLDYWSRIDASVDRPGLVIVQHVIQLGDGRLPSRLSRGLLDFSFEVRRLCDEDPDRLLAATGLAPFAALGRMPHRHRPAALAKALAIVAEVEDAHRREHLARATMALAHSRLDPDTIMSTYEEIVMPLPSVNDVFYEAGVIRSVASLLRVRFGEDERIDGIARRLSILGPDDAIARAERADSLDDLA